MDSPSFRWMDRNAPLVLAAAPGQVTNLHDAETDRNTGAFDRNPFCDGGRNLGNFVEVTHADGSRAIYAHLKADSVTVSEHEVVTSGQKLGVVGSSGCSTWPHLHFEVLTADGEVLDPFVEEMWLEPPAYDVPLTIMDYNVTDEPISEISELADPPPNSTTIALGATLGVGLNVAGGLAMDTLRIELRDQSEALKGEWNFREHQRHGLWRWNRTIRGTPGQWQITIAINGTTAVTHTLTVTRG